MTKEIFVVCALRDLGWVDIAEFNDAASAFLKSDEIRATEIDSKVVRRWVGNDHINAAILLGKSR